jgi:hypothetical protein
VLGERVVAMEVSHGDSRQKLGLKREPIDVTPVL